ncbi:hypothetical protein ACIBI9_06705 [Nonomuraea sp. NPDC050451]|uniref:hypothetical protein n=1 Tax=Nonomuraea sp. NPDC050451 TaxID=3364364 RepID=UPI00379BDE5B
MITLSGEVADKLAADPCASDQGFEGPFTRACRATLQPSGPGKGPAGGSGGARARTSAQAIMDELRQALSRTPIEVPEEEAASIGRKYGLA